MYEYVNWKKNVEKNKFKSILKLWDFVECIFPYV